MSSLQARQDTTMGFARWMFHLNLIADKQRLDPGEYTIGAKIWIVPVFPPVLLC